MQTCTTLHTRRPVLTQDTQACGDTNATCLCSPSTISAIMRCENCYFQTLIHEFRVAPEDRAAKATVINSGSCRLSVTCIC